MSTELIKLLFVLIAVIFLLVVSLQWYLSGERSNPEGYKEDEADSNLTTYLKNSIVKYLVIGSLFHIIYYIM